MWMNIPEWQIQIICNTTGDRFTASAFDKLLCLGFECQQLVKDMKAKNHKKLQPATSAVVKWLH